MYYNVCGAASLGGKYESFKWFLYRVGSLLPGVVIGVDLVITRLRKAEHRWLKLVSKIFSILYLAFFEYLWLFGLYICFPHYHYQSTRQVIVSYRDAMHFYIYYYGFMQYLPCWILSLICIFSRPIKKAELSPLRRNLEEANPDSAGAVTQASVDVRINDSASSSSDEEEGAPRDKSI